MSVAQASLFPLEDDAFHFALCRGSVGHWFTNTLTWFLLWHLALNLLSLHHPQDTHTNTHTASISGASECQSHSVTDEGDEPIEQRTIWSAYRWRCVCFNREAPTPTNTDMHKYTLEIRIARQEDQSRKLVCTFEYRGARLRTDSVQNKDKVRVTSSSNLSQGLLKRVGSTSSLRLQC